MPCAKTPRPGRPQRLLTLGRSTHDSTTTTTTTTAAGSNVNAGGNVRISATGDGEASTLTIQGSHVRGDNMTYLKADGDIALLAAANTTTSDRQAAAAAQVSAWP